MEELLKSLYEVRGNIWLSHMLDRRVQLAVANIDCAIKLVEEQIKDDRLSDYVIDEVLRRRKRT